MANEITHRIVDFFKDGASLHGRGTLAALAASVVLTGVTMAAAFHPATSEVPRLSADENAAVVADIQARLDREAPGAGIMIMDLSRDTSDQIAAFTRSGRQAECIVYAAGVNGHELMPGVAQGDISPSDYSRWAIYSDVAQCLGADGVEHAKMFGVLMTYMDTGSKDFAPVMAAWTDLNELRGLAQPSEFWSETAWKVSGALHNQRFLTHLESTDLLETFDISQKAWEASERGMRAAFGRAFREALIHGHHYVPVDGGVLDTDPVTWMNLMAEDLPPVAHFGELWGYLHSAKDTPRPSVGALDVDWSETLSTLEELGLKGDSTSRLLAKGLGSAIDFDYQPVVDVQSPFDPAELRGVLYEADITGLQVVYDVNGRGFAATDESRVPVLVGMGDGIGIHPEFRVEGKVVQYPRREVTEERIIGASLR